MERKLEMRVLHDEISKGNPDDYAYEYGTFVDDKLEGIGTHARGVVKEGEKPKIVCLHGYFHKGLLNGPAYIVDQVQNCVVLGYFENGRLLSPAQLVGFAAKALEEKQIKGDRTYLISDLTCYSKTERGILIELYYGTIGHYLVHFISGPKKEVLENPMGFVHMKMSKEGKTVFGLEMRLDSDGKPWVCKSYGEPISSNQEAAYLCSPSGAFRLFHFVDVHIEEGREVVKDALYNGPYSVRLHVPVSVKKLYPDIIRNAHAGTRQLEVFYEGTKAQWAGIDKETTEEVVKEDWYGYYYHNSDRYESYIVHHRYSADCRVIAVHCSDGDYIEEN